jgi:hypothetical protein
MIALDVNTSEVAKYTKRLNEMRKFDFPLAVRGTLNDLAFHHKQKELLLVAGELFILRNPNFIRSHSAVNKADGWDVNTMRSESGIAPKGLKAAEQLETQEKGGTIPDRTIIYVDPARGGRKQNRVSTKNWINKSGYVKGKPIGGYGNRSRKSNMVAEAFVANKTGKLVKLETKSTDHFFKVDSIKFNGRGVSRNVNIKMTPIASYEKGRSVKVKRTPFMQISGERTLSLAPGFYIKNAKKRFEKS